MKDTLPEELPVPLPRPVIDSHTHLDTVTAYTGCSPEEAIAQAATVGVTRLVQIGCDVADSRWAVDLARAQPSVRATVALHPNEAARLWADDPERLTTALVEIDELAGSAPHLIRAVGETGLDFFRTTDDGQRAAQRDSFIAHIEMATRHGLTLVIHDRDAHDEVLAVLDEQGWPDRVIMHCFSGDAAHARACLERGAWLSFPGPVTYRANDHLREALAITPADRILVETDAPFLVPVPWRGWPNAPVLLPHTVRFCAEHRSVELAEFCDQLTANTVAAYGGEWPSAG